jgi:hypothetical protein
MQRKSSGRIISSRRWALAALVGVVIIVGCVIWLLPARHSTSVPNLKAAYRRAAQRLYRHELLSLYHPPEEAFTPHGLQLLHRVQDLYSPVFLPYLVTGAVPIQPDVLYNPWFDLFILVEDVDGQINSVLLASSRGSDQQPQLAVTERFWQEIYRRYQVAQMASFANPKPFDENDQAILELRNLTNQCGWPAQVQFAHAGATFDLYLQRPAQAVYCSPIEPGTYVVFNYHDDRLYTNVVSLPPYSVRQLEKTIAESFKGQTGRRAEN